MNKKRGVILCVLTLALALAFAFAACDGGGADTPEPPATPEYTVTFSVDGGSTVSPQTVKEGNAAVEPNSPTKEGFKFAGWYKESSLTTLWVFSSDKVTSDTTLYAKWTALYTVTFATNGGSSISPLTVEEGSTIKPQATTKTGHTFAGWYKDADYATEWNFVTEKVTTDTTLYAKWTVNSYTVTYDSQGGSEVASAKAEYDSLLTKPEDPTKEGYIFNGWCKDEGYNEQWIFAADKVTGDITLHAKWLEETVVTYTVTFESYGGGEIPAMTEVPENGMITAPSEPTKAGYRFDGWYKEAKYVTLWNFATDKVTTDTTLHAKWTALYTVMFESNGGSIVDALTEIADGSTIAAPAEPTRAHYVFGGWYEDNETFETKWRFDRDTVTKDTTLHAKWTPESYTVKYDTQGGSTVSDGKADYDTLLTKPNDPTRKGYTFAGWYKEAECQEAWDFAADKITGATVLYAKWEAESYAVTFVSNGGSEVTGTTAEYDSLLTAPQSPTRQGYRFDGWYKDAGFAAAWDFATEKVTGITVLYAKWTIESYTVTFDTDGGTEVESQTIVFDKPATEPTDPTKTGHTFDGWYKDDAYQYKWDFASNKITENTVIYAKWTVNKYKVTFDTLGGNTISSKTVEYNNAIGSVAAPIKTGNIFEGWYVDEDYTTPWNIANDKVIGDMTLYAKWKGPMTFTLNGNGTYTLTAFDSKLQVGDTIDIPAEYNGKPVTAIGESCFESNDKVKYINIPDGIETIGRNAFSRCANLQEIILPDTVKTIGSQLCYRSVNLKSIKLSENLTELPSSIVDNCAIDTLDIPASVTTIKYGALGDITGMIWIPKTVTVIEKYAFHSAYPLHGNNDSLAVFVAYAESEVPAGWADGWDLDTASVTYGVASKPAVIDNIMYLVENDHAVVAKYMGRGLSYLEIPDQVTIDNRSYSVKTIKAGAFTSSDLALLYLPDSLTEIEDTAFTSSSGIHIWLPQSVTTIGATALSAGNIIYTDSASKQDGWLFDTAVAANVNYSSVKPVIENDYLIVLQGNAVALVAYIGTERDITLPVSSNIGGQTRNITAINGNAFKLSNVRTIIVPDTYTTLAVNAFVTSEDTLQMLYLPKSIVNVAGNIFEECISTNILVAHDQTSSWPEKWMGDSSYPLYTASKPELIDGVWYTAIEDRYANAVITGTGVTEVTVKSVVTLGGKTYNVTNVGLGRYNGQIIGFADTTVTKITIEEGITNIGMGVFTGCNSLTEIVIPSTVERIYYVFYECNNLIVYLNKSEIPEGWDFRGRPVYVYSENDPGATAVPSGAVGFWHYNENHEPVNW